jgi:2,4-dihydroxy-1,4-benzoxazin-3-one-glucoside dioxygenase
MSPMEEAAGGGLDDYDRLSELKAFDDSKAGVKGLVDAGVTTIPAIFRGHLLQEGPKVSSASSSSSTSLSIIPVIDLSAADAVAREEVVAQVKAAAETVGFFQLVNHGVPSELLSEMLASVRRFNEEPHEVKRPYYTRDARRKVRFNSNFDLFQSPAANWRDTLFCEAAPEPPRAEELPVAVRHVMLEYGGAVREVAARVLGLLSEALGLSPGHLAGMGCAEGLSLVCNYYPPCPEPDLTLGCSRHSDPSFLTVLLQDSHAQGGLQALLASRWLDVPPVAGALLVNVGDLLQLVSNGRFKSVEHRVVANRSRDTARVSVACFCNADIARSTRLYGPIAELIAADDSDGAGRALYRNVTVPEFLAHYDKKGLDGRPALHRFQLLQ